MKTIKTFDNPMEAHIFKARLESEGIDSYLFDENIMTLNLMYNITVGGIKLNVAEHDVLKVNEILREIEMTTISDDNDNVIICENCNSKNIYSGFKSLKGFKSILAWIVSLLFGGYPLYLRNVYRCKDCGTEFQFDDK